MAFSPDHPNDFPTLGYGVLDWMVENLATPGAIDYEPFFPTQEQADFILRFYELDPVTGRRLIRRGVISRSRGWGKALALDTPIPTPEGWATMADLAIGDQVFDETGNPCTVLAKSPIWTDTDTYRVTFSDGESIVASGDHLWTVRNRNRKQPETVTTRHIHSVGSKRSRYSVWNAKSTDLGLVEGFRGIAAIERTASEPTVCIEVDSASHLFLAGRKMVPTHNSPMLSAMGIAEGLADVVFDGWDAYGKPVGKPWNQIAQPLVVVAAATEDQTFNAWAPLLDMLTADAPIHDNYQGVEPMDSQINLPYGKIMPVASSSNATKGLPTQFALLDQTEQWVSRESKKLFTILKNNTAKNAGSFIEAPNAYAPGEGSVAETSATAYFAMVEGRSKNETGLLYDHREAPGATDPYDRKSVEYGLRVAYGDASGHKDGCVLHEPPCEPGWVDLETLIQSMWDEDADEIESRADFLNQITQSSDAWIGHTEWSAQRYSELDPPVHPVRPGEAITLGFDGSRGRVKGKPDATALIGVRVEDGHVFQLGLWEASDDKKTWPNWEPSIPEIEALLYETFKKYQVVGFFADPGKDWRSHINAWEAKYGSKVRVKASRNHPFEWWMGGGRISHVEKAIESCESAITLGDMSHDGSYGLTRHVLNTKRRLNQGRLMLSKEGPSSPHKIDAAVAMVLAWEARQEAVAKGLGARIRPNIPRRVR